MNGAGAGRHRRTPRQRGTLVFTKPAVAVEDLAGQLEDRGLMVPDHDRAVRYLRHLGYFRLSPYTIPFQCGRVEHLFRDGTVFDDVLDLYVFDRALRLLIMDALERVEVAIRAALTDHMATVHQEPCWHTDASHFKEARQHNGLLTCWPRGRRRTSRAWGCLPTGRRTSSGHGI